MVCEEAGTRQVDSPPQVNLETTPVSRQVTTTPEPAPPTQPEASTAPPADDPSSEEDPQLREETNYQQLALPLVLTERPHWTTAETRRKIERDCGEDGNRKCRQCGRKFTTTWRLRVHVPQHYTNICCPCGKFSFQRNYVLRHQRIARCHMGQIFMVDRETFPDFRDLVLPHVCDPHKRATLAQGFPACRPTLESTDEEAAPPAPPSTTQPLRIMLSRVDNTGVRTPQLAGVKRR